MKSQWRLGGLTVAIIVAIFATSLLAIIAQTRLDFFSLWQNAYLRHIVWFSFYQAFLSSLLSIVFAIPIALSLNRRNFTGKIFFMRLLNVIMAIPALIAVLGILSIYGNSGLIHSLSAIALFNVYGLSGILIAHTFFNIPFAVRIFYHELDNISVEEQKISLQLGLNAWQKFKLLEMPELAKNILQVASLIFILCFTSFAIVMILGGSPKYSTLEVAIYEAFYYSLDFNLGAGLVLWQIVFCLILILIANLFGKNITAGFTGINEKIKFFRDSKLLKISDFLILLLALVFLISPLVGLVIQALDPKGLEIFSHKTFYESLVNSLIISLGAGFLSLVFAISLINANIYFRLRSQKIRASIFDFTSNIILIIPSLALATGLFLLFYDSDYLNIISYFIIVIINSLMALPFVNKILLPNIMQLEKRYSHLFINLKINSFTKLYYFQYLAIKPVFREAFGFAMVMALGDLSAIALFGNNLTTISVYLFSLLGSYKTQSAWTLAFVLLVLCFGIFSLTKVGLGRYVGYKKS